MEQVETSYEKFINTILSIPAENRTTEFKRLGADSVVKKVTETIVAMANTDGGYIVLGVDDPEQSKLNGYDRIFGIEEGPERYDEIGRNIQRITPPLLISWPPAEVKSPNGKTIAVIFVDKALACFHSVTKHVFVRLEKGNKQLNPHEIVTLSYAKGFHQADKELIEVDFDLLKTEYYDRWRRARGITDGEIKDILFDTGLARTNDAGELNPTRAAVLLFALYPHNLMDTKCTIRVFQYEGAIETITKTLNLLGAPKTIDGPVIKQIADAHEYILALLRSGIKMPSSGFVTTYRIPERALTEAITNAVIHRDYYLKRDIEVDIFEDKVTVRSPGLFPSNITVDNIGRVRAQGYRNDILVKHLREFPDPPNLDRNEGVRAMRVEMDRSNLYPPIFITYPTLQDAVCVVLLNTIRATEWDKVSNYLTNEAKYVMNSDVRRIIKNPDTTKVSRLLRQWVDRGLLIKIDTGAKKTTKYRLPSRVDLFSQ